MDFDTRDEIVNERVRVFREFLEDESSVYPEKIKKMVDQEGSQRLIVNVNHLRDYNAEYCKGLLEEPMEFLPPLERALNEHIQTWGTQVAEPGQDLPLYYIGLDGSFGDHLVSPRNLNSSHLGMMLSIEAIVTRCSLVRPKITKSVHYCEATDMFTTREYRDGLALTNEMPTSSVYPREDENGNTLSTEFGYSTYKDFQMIYVQEMPERSPVGKMPRAIDVLLDQDLTDCVKPGDRVVVTGVYRTRGKNSASSSAVFSTFLLANNVTLMNKEIAEPTLTEKNARQIRNISRRPDAFKLLSNSLAPSLFGHDYIKKALLLLMLGGVEKNLENGTHLRGDINILLIGDPSVGKSQMLRFVLNLAPLAIATTGRGSSGVGLTAAVTQDKETGERTLEAGAMVLADRGVVCIDEFDKMSDIDRVAIHEVMEQQTVTIAKAGIHTSLNARCSVLAAANPAYGTYLDEKKPFENITMPDSLLSRFDLVFVVLDKTDDEFNRAIADHVTRLHRYIPPGVPEGTPVTEEMVRMLSASHDDQENREETPVFEKYNELLHIGIRNKKKSKKKEVEILSIPFLKKYLYYAKNRVNPVLTPEAADYISNCYSELRAKVDGNQDQYRTMPITPRTLETLIRLSTAHAKSRLSKNVEQVDAEVAHEILVFALFKEYKKKTRTKKQRLEDSDSDSEDDNGSSAYTTVAPSLLSRNTRQTAANLISEENGSQQPSDHTDSTANTSSGLLRNFPPVGQDDSMVVEKEIVANESTIIRSGETAVNTPIGDSQASVSMSEERYTEFCKHLNVIREKYTHGRDDTQSVLIDDLMDELNAQNPSTLYSKAEVVNRLQIMNDANLALWWQDDNETLLFF